MKKQTQNGAKPFVIPEFNSVQLGEDLWRFREKNGLTLETISESCGIGQSTLYRIEAAKSASIDKCLSVIYFIGKRVDDYVITKTK